MVLLKYQHDFTAKESQANKNGHMMNGRFFGGTQVEAYVVEGKVRFKKSGASAAAALQDDGAGWEAEAGKDDEAQRLDKFGAWLEREKEAAKETADS